LCQHVPCQKIGTGRAQAEAKRVPPVGMPCASGVVVAWFEP
jgi:hypothetical protein